VDLKAVAGKLRDDGQDKLDSSDQDQRRLEPFEEIFKVWPEPPSDESMTTSKFLSISGMDTCRARCVLHMSLDPCSGYLTNPLPEDDRLDGLGFVEDYEDIFITVTEWGAFQASDIERNWIRISSEGCTPAPDFVADLEQKLDSKPGLESDVCCFPDHSFDADESM
jgi:hypothetical protein